MPDFIHSLIDDGPGRGRKPSTVECAIAGALVVPAGTTVFSTLGTAISTRIKELATDVTAA